MKTHLLLRLADYLETRIVNNPIGFDLEDWSQTDPKTFCHTAACAVGHACLSGIFLSEGLSFFVETEPGQALLVPTYQGVNGFQAVEKFFGINDATAEILFYWESYPAYKGLLVARAVAARIRAAVKNHKIGQEVEKIKERALA